MVESPPQMLKIYLISLNRSVNRIYAYLQATQNKGSSDISWLGCSSFQMKAHPQSDTLPFIIKGRVRLPNWMIFWKSAKWPIYASSVHKTELSNLTKNKIVLCPKHGAPPHNGPKSLILAPQDIPDISGYQVIFGCQCVKVYNNENPVTN